MAGAPFAKVMTPPAGTGHEYYLCQQTVQHFSVTSDLLVLPLERGRERYDDIITGCFESEPNHF
jgi:hypothetical protein